MKKSFISFFLVSSMISIQAFAGLDASHWSMRFLARASNSILVASNQSLDQQKVLCGISGRQVSMLSQNLKALVDEKMSHLTTRQKKEIRQHALSCQKECTCDIYSYYFEQSSDPKDKQALTDLSPAKEKMTAETRLVCAQKFSEFCHSQLFKFISK
jgi:hypothetical protein